MVHMTASTDSALPTPAAAARARELPPIGTGAFRSVHAVDSTDPWVYKWPHEPGSEIANEWEWGAYLEQQETPYLPAGVRLPVTHRLQVDGVVVLAAERVPDRLPPHLALAECTCVKRLQLWSGCWVQAAADTAELQDVRVDDAGTLVLLDMGQ